MEAALVGSFRSPNTIALVGQASAHAGRYATGSVTGLPSAVACWRAACQRPWQKLHFSTTPRMRGATSGLRVFSMPAGQAGSPQLEERGGEGQGGQQARPA